MALSITGPNGSFNSNMLGFPLVEGVAGTLGYRRGGYGHSLPYSRHRPSHRAKGWARHPGKDENSRIPMPFRRGVPFRGDMLGGDIAEVQGITSPTG